MMIITRVVIFLSCIVIMFCFDKSKGNVGTIALALLILAIAYGYANG